MSASADITKKMARGAAWMIMMRLSARGLGLISTAILARLLIPADFGLVALATILLGLLEVFSAFGFDVVLIRDRSKGTGAYDTVWTMTLIRGLLIAALLIAGAGPAAVMFDNPKLEPVVYFLAIAALADGVQNVGIVNFRKEMTFGKEFTFTMVSRIGMFAVTVPLAFLWRDHWALVAGIVAGRWIRVALSYAMHPFRPRLSLQGWRGIFDFSKWLLINNVSQFVYNRADTFMIGKVMGAASLGIYSVAYQVSNLATTELIMPIRRVMLPGYAKLRGDPKAFRQSIVESFAIIVALGAPAAIGIGLVADPLVHVLLGEQWIEAIPIIQILALYGLINIFYANIWPAMVAMGRPGIMSGIAIGGALGVVPLLFVGLTYAGLAGAAWAITFTAFMQVCAGIAACSVFLGVSPLTLLANIWRSLLSLLCMAASVLFLETFWPLRESFSDHVAALAAFVLCGAAVYLGVHLGLWGLSGSPAGPERSALRLIPFRSRKQKKRSIAT